MGGFGAAVVPDGARVLTHCNAGALATAGYGSALGVIRAAVEQGKKVAVFADETRPFLQGARLTAWELRARRHRHDGHHREHGRPADARRARSTSSSSAPTASPPTATPRTRSAPTPSRCSRTSTRSRSTSRRRSRRSTSRRRTATTSRSRSAIEREVTHLGSSRLTPDGAQIRNPAFDVTPHRYITGIITETRHLRGRRTPSR